MRLKKVSNCVLGRSDPSTYGALVRLGVQPSLRPCWKTFLSLTQGGVLIVASTIFPSAAISSAGDAEKELVCAALNFTTAPAYVPITVINAKTKEIFHSTVESTTLHEALVIEFGVSDSQDDRRYFERIKGIIHRHADLRFTLKNKVAVGKLKPIYDGTALQAMRHAISRLDASEIVKGLSDNGELHLLYRTNEENSYYSRQAALASALLERGLYPGRGDYVPDMYLMKSPCERNR